MIEVETKTLSTIIVLQLFGNSSFKFSVVIQIDALVVFAIDLYFFEWKKVSSLDCELCKSCISVIFKSSFMSLNLRFKAFNI